jgi:hypothetical protein
MPRTFRTLRSLALLLALACSRAEWTTLRSPEGGFEVEMPAVPELARHTVETVLGPLEFTVHSARLGSASYQIIWVEYPEGAIEDQEAVLDAARDGAVARSGSRLVREESIEVEGHPGREIELDVQGRIVGLDRLFLVGNRLYQILLAGDPGSLHSAEALRFLASFRLI